MSDSRFSNEFIRMGSSYGRATHASVIVMGDLKRIVSVFRVLAVERRSLSVGWSNGDKVKLRGFGVRMLVKLANCTYVSHEIPYL